MHLCRVCGFYGDFEETEVVTYVRVDVRPYFEEDREYHSAEVEHERITLHVCPECRIVYYF